MKKLMFIGLLSLFIDQISKYIIILNMEIQQSIKIIGNFFHLTYVRNYGAAWNIFDGNKIFLIIVGIGSLFLIYNYFLKNQHLTKYQTILYGVLMGGILGNLIDRITWGFVIDFLDFNIFGYKFPVFNLADSFIVITMSLIIIELLRDGKNENRNN